MVPNDKLLESVQEQTSLLEAFEMADEVLKKGVQGISDIIVDDALINLDFADVTTIMKDRGIVHMGVGIGKGETKLFSSISQAEEISQCTMLTEWLRRSTKKRTRMQ